jgi:dipeptidyl aminopeptidase/acylaminoacyl peptidase
MTRGIGKLTVLAILFALVSIGPALAQDGGGWPYTVQAGDTLAALADKYLGDYKQWPEIVAATQAKHAQDSSFAAIENPNQIESGWKLWIPGPGTTPTAKITPTPEPMTLAASGSPTGTIAFSFYNPAPKRKVYEIDLIKPDGSGRYIFPPDNVSEPALSPDGKRIAFRSWGTYRGARCLATSRLDGSEFQCITRFFEDANPDWSSDGRTIIFATQRESDRRWRMRTVRPDEPSDKDEQDESDKKETAIGRDDRQSLYGEDPSWAPDDWRFVYRGCDPTGNRCGLWVMTLDGKVIFPILEDASASDPDWSPNGERIVFRASSGGWWNLWAINADGSGLARLTDDPAVDALPVWSPDGEWIAFLSDLGGNWGIYIMRADGSERRLVFAFDGGSHTPPDRAEYGPRSWADEQLSWSVSTF